MSEEVEVVKGPAVEGPADSFQYVPPLDSDRAPVVSLSRKARFAPANKVYNVGDEEIALQARLNEVES